MILLKAITDEQDCDRQKFDVEKATRKLSDNKKSEKVQIR